MTSVCTFGKAGERLLSQARLCCKTPQPPGSVCDTAPTAGPPRWGLRLSARKYPRSLRQRKTNYFHSCSIKINTNSSVQRADSPLRHCVVTALTGRPSAAGMREWPRQWVDSWSHSGRVLDWLDPSPFAHTLKTIAYTDKDCNDGKADAWTHRTTSSCNWLWRHAYRRHLRPGG